MGRPTKYNKGLCETLPEMFRNGASVAEVCAELGISKDTFYRWEKMYPTFSDAIKQGKTLAEAWWSRLGMQAAKGEVPKANPAIWIFNMKNRFGWTDKQEITGGDGSPLMPNKVTIEFIKANESTDT